MSISKIAHWVLYAMLAVTVVVLGLYYGGGYVDQNAEILEPKNTEILLNWAYILIGAGVIATIGFALFQFMMSVKETPKKALGTVINIALFVAVMGGAWALGDSTPLNLPGYDGLDNVGPTLKIADMMLYATYFLIGVAILLVVFSNVSKLIKK
ncbi:MAG: hypothetical protein ACRCX4_13050 [Bacteroidales bacterium]